MKKHTKLILRITALIVTIRSIYFLAPWKSGLLYLSPLPSTVQEQVDDGIRYGINGAIVYVQKEGEPAKFYASGWHNIEEKTPATPNALFKIASIGKLYNATAIAKLVAKGTLSLDKTLADYLPSLIGRIEYADKITLRMMVQHRSGIPNYTDHKSFSWSDNSIGVNDNLTLVLDLPANFEPGTDYKYSNTNYLLLGRIMTKILGYDHTQFIKDEILTPLDLKRTFFSMADINLDELMSGYHVGYEDDFKALNQGYIASAEDVGIFLRALNTSTLLTEKEQAIYSSIYEYEHTGWVLGYYSIARYHKELDTVVIQFVNTVGDNTLTLANVMYYRIINLLEKND